MFLDRCCPLPCNLNSHLRIFHTWFCFTKKSIYIWRQHDNHFILEQFNHRYGSKLRYSNRNSKCHVPCRSHGNDNREKGESNTTTKCKRGILPSVEAEREGFSHPTLFCQRNQPSTLLFIALSRFDYLVILH